MPLKFEIRSLLTHPKKAPSRKVFVFALDRWIQEAPEHAPWQIWENLATSTGSKAQDVEQNEIKVESDKRSVQAEDGSLHEWT
jgi:hypothetical protein